VTRVAREVGTEGRLAARPRSRASPACRKNLTAEPAFGADLARDPRHLRREAVQLIDHRVDRVLELEDLTLDVDVILRDRSPLAIAVATSAMLRTWPVRFDAIELTLSVRSFQVPATPGTCACPPSLPSCRLAGDAADLGGKAVQLIDHRVDRVLELEDLALDVDRDLA